MKIVPYVITQNQLITSQFKPIVYLPAECTVIHIDVENDDIILYVEQFESNELYPRKIVITQVGNLPSDIENGLVYHSSIKYKNNTYFIYLNEFKVHLEPSTMVN